MINKINCISFLLCVRTLNGFIHYSPTNCHSYNHMFAF